MAFKVSVGVSAVATAIVMLAAVPVVARQPEPRPSRETITVSFTKPVLVGDRVLLGKYVIEHDNYRMARGRPCTHIYAASDMRLPVVAFRCTHLNQPVGPHPSVTLRSLHESNGMSRLTAFQFAGEHGAHGVPMTR